MMRHIRFVVETDGTSGIEIDGNLYETNAALGERTELKDTFGYDGPATLTPRYFSLLLRLAFESKRAGGAAALSFDQIVGLRGWPSGPSAKEDIRKGADKALIGPGVYVEHGRVHWDVQGEVTFSDEQACRDWLRGSEGPRGRARRREEGIGGPSSAVVVGVDLVGLALREQEEQRDLIVALTAIVRAALGALLAPERDEAPVVALPTGDGITLAFLRAAHAPWARSTILDFIHRLQHWAREKGVALRIGVHDGTLDLIEDINGRRNVCGDTLQYARRVLDAADPRQVLFSDAAYGKLVGAAREFVELREPAPAKRARFVGPMPIYARDRPPIILYKMVLDPPEPDWWCDRDPAEKGAMTVSLTPLPKTVESFSQQVRAARKVAFIQLTGDKLLPMLESSAQPFSPMLRTLHVFMPHPESYPGMGLEPAHADLARIAQWADRWRHFLARLRTVHKDANIKLGLFRLAPFIGASFLDWDLPGHGRIHVSPYLWGIPTRDCPGYDLFWSVPTQPGIYEAYVRALKHLDEETPNALDSEPTPRRTAPASPRRPDSRSPAPRSQVKRRR